MKAGESSHRHAFADLGLSDLRIWERGVVNLWGLCLKADKPGSLIGDPTNWWERYVTGNGVPALSVRVPHILRLSTLPEFHKDPFDRILVAQAMVENLPLVTKDSMLSKYGVSVIW